MMDQIAQVAQNRSIPHHSSLILIFTPLWCVCVYVLKREKSIYLEYPAKIIRLKIVEIMSYKRITFSPTCDSDKESNVMCRDTTGRCFRLNHADT